MVTVSGIGPSARKKWCGRLAAESPSGQQGREGRDSRPVVHLLDEAGCDRIHGDVEEFFENVLLLDKLDNGGATAGPEIVPPSAQRVLTPREELVHALVELVDSSMPVVDQRMMVIGHCLREDDGHVEALGGFRQAVEIVVVGLRVWPHEELPQQTPTGDHVETTGKHGTWSCHARVCRKQCATDISGLNYAKRRGRGERFCPPAGRHVRYAAGPRTFEIDNNLCRFCGESPENNPRSGSRIRSGSRRNITPGRGAAGVGEPLGRGAAKYYPRSGSRKYYPRSGSRGGARILPPVGEPPRNITPGRGAARISRPRAFWTAASNTCSTPGPAWPHLVAICTALLKISSSSGSIGYIANAKPCLARRSYLRRSNLNRRAARWRTFCSTSSVSRRRSMERIFLRKLRLSSSVPSTIS